jgi:hypothetical protein
MGSICLKKDIVEHPLKKNDTKGTTVSQQDDENLFRSLHRDETTTSFEDIRKVYKFDPKVVGNQRLAKFEKK